MDKIIKLSIIFLVLGSILISGCIDSEKPSEIDGPIKPVKDEKLNETELLSSENTDDIIPKKTLISDEYGVKENLVSSPDYVGKDISNFIVNDLIVENNIVYSGYLDEYNDVMDLELSGNIIWYDTVDTYDTLLYYSIFTDKNTNKINMVYYRTNINEKGYNYYIVLADRDFDGNVDYFEKWERDENTREITRYFDKDGDGIIDEIDKTSGTLPG